MGKDKYKEYDSDDYSQYREFKSFQKEQKKYEYDKKLRQEQFARQSKHKDLKTQRSERAQAFLNAQALRNGRKYSDTESKRLLKHKKYYSSSEDSSDSDSDSEKTTSAKERKLNRALFGTSFVPFEATKKYKEQNYVEPFIPISTVHGQELDSSQTQDVSNTTEAIEQKPIREIVFTPSGMNIKYFDGDDDEFHGTSSGAVDLEKFISVFNGTDKTTDTQTTSNTNTNTVNNTQQNTQSNTNINNGLTKQHIKDFYNLLKRSTYMLFVESFQNFFSKMYTSIINFGMLKTSMVLCASVFFTLLSYGIYIWNGMFLIGTIKIGFFVSLFYGSIYLISFLKNNSPFLCEMITTFLPIKFAKTTIEFVYNIFKVAFLSIYIFFKLCCNSVKKIFIKDGL